ncbi:hypothetical protein [Amycolatopsis nigrescens]|uniref:hypothetical protein n=1 Tax=Amycolatopsis nigrescens TaxID=381445 RepID=UPI00036610BF|nr:hypothetical protein [Amycolatopsis nigrescens]
MNNHCEQSAKFPNRARSLALVAAGAGLCLALAGCSGGSSPEPAITITSTSTMSSDPAANPAAVQWMDGFCGAIHGYREANNRPAEQPAVGTVEEAQKQISDTLGTLATQMGKAVDDLNALPPAPVPLAETVQKTYLDKYTAGRDTAANAKATLDKAKRGDEKSQFPAADAVEAAQKKIADAYDPVGPVMGSPELSAAAASAPKCTVRS